MDSLSLTSEQLFFLSYAQVWCSDNSAEYEAHKMMTNTHPPSSLRVLATLRNSPEFGDAFKCPRESFMNPNKIKELQSVWIKRLETNE